jgi:hypothetical protein
LPRREYLTPEADSCTNFEALDALSNLDVIAGVKNEEEKVGPMGHHCNNNNNKSTSSPSWLGLWTAHLYHTSYDTGGSALYIFLAMGQ